MLVCGWKRAEIDYIGPFVKAWASFNAWYREASRQKKDSEGLRYVKQQANPVRSAIMPLLQPVQTDGHGNPLPDAEAAQKFKLLIRDLHVCLDTFHIEVTKKDVLERISFRAVYLGRVAKYPADFRLQADAILRGQGERPMAEHNQLDCQSR